MVSDRIALSPNASNALGNEMSLKTPWCTDRLLNTIWDVDELLSSWLKTVIVAQRASGTRVRSGDVANCDVLLVL